MNDPDQTINNDETIPEKEALKNTEITKYNAVKHGILRETITAYETSDYEAFYAELEGDIKPKSLLEKLMLGRIVVNKIKLDRITKAESEAIKQSLNPKVVQPMIDHSWDIVVSNGYKPQVSSGTIQSLELYSRYETQAENRMYRAIQTLQSLRK
jgi:hypothetical protein